MATGSSHDFRPFEAVLLARLPEHRNNVLLLALEGLWLCNAGQLQLPDIRIEILGRVICVGTRAFQQAMKEIRVIGDAIAGIHQQTTNATCLVTVREFDINIVCGQNDALAWPLGTE